MLRAVDEGRAEVGITARRRDGDVLPAQDIPGTPRERVLLVRRPGVAFACRLVAASGIRCFPALPPGDPRGWLRSRPGRARSHHAIPDRPRCATWPTGP